MGCIEEDKTPVSYGINGLNVMKTFEASKKSLDLESALIDIGGFD
jgi:hypothetical protein